MEFKIFVLYDSIISVKSIIAIVVVVVVMIILIHYQIIITHSIKGCPCFLGDESKEFHSEASLRL